MMKLFKQRILLLVAIMVVVVAAVLATSMHTLYQTAVEQQRLRLTETVKSQSELMQSLARFDEQYNQDVIPGGATAASLSQIFDAFGHLPGISQTFEFVLARKEGDQIAFLATRRSMGQAPSFTVPIDSTLAEPMRRALAGKSGTVIAPDYQERQVLAAYEYVPILNLGIVAKLDMWEIQQPFIRAITVSVVEALCFILLGAWLFHYIASPLVRRLMDSEIRYRDLSESLKQSNQNLEEQVAERTRKLRNEQQRTHLLLESVAEGIYGLDREGRTSFVNPAAAAMLGYRPDELIGRSMHALVHHSHADGSKYPQENCPMYASITDGRVHQISNEVLWRKDGSSFPVQYSSTPMRQDGELIGAVISFSDMTRVRKAKAALHKAHAFNERLIRSIPSILIATDADRMVTLWNRAAEQATGIAAAEAVGKHVMDCGVQCNWMEVARKVAACRKTGHSRLDNFKFRRADGSEGFLGLSFTPIIIEDADITGYMLLGSDITERIQLQNRLHLSQKMEAVGELAAGIAHEINTPLQYVGDNMRFLKESFGDIESVWQQAQYLRQACVAQNFAPELVVALERVDEEADMAFLMTEIPDAITQSLDGVNKAANIVRAMKEFSHPGQKEKSLIDINRMLENTVTVARNEWKYVAQVLTEFDEELPMVRCLPELNQVFLNLIVNAAHAIAEKLGENAAATGLITLRTSHDKRQVCIEIADSGAGIPESLRQKVFEPFFTTKDVGKGTGQGLAIAHNIVVDQHGGSIALASVEGEGTTFIIHLPVDDEGDEG